MHTSKNQIVLAEEAFKVFSTNSSSILRFLLHILISSDEEFEEQLVVFFGDQLLVEACGT